ncbi:MAG: LamG-like jellyroll fold domain-containing protein, partial [Flavobacteriaceae bacterium]
MRNSKYIIFFNSLLFLIQIQLVQSQLTSNGLVLNLDASNSTSYSGIGATWNDISGNNNHFNINTATYNSEGYFVFDGDDSMTGPPSNSFGLSQTDHTIEIILEPVSGGGSVINFRGDSHNYGINAHLPWSSNVIFYDVGGCCDSDDRIEGGPNIVGQKTHVILRSKPSGDSKREVFVNGSSVINSGSSNTSTNNFTSVEATIGGFIYSDGNSHHTNSKIYSVRVYNRALTDQEISNNYNHYLHPNNIPVVNTHVTSGLVMYVDAENDLSYNGSGLSWNDLSGNNNNGTISGASYDSDRKSFDFDGNDDKVSFPAVLSEGDDTYTIEAYFKTDQNNKTQVIWEQNTSVSTSHRRGCMILLSDGEGGFNGQNNDRHDEIDYSAGLWNHWVIAIDNNGGYPQVEMYVNGVLHWQGNQANGGELNLGSHGSAIGYKLSSNGEYFNGEIKSVRIYNRKLNADEIKQNYWSTINRYLVTDGLQLYLDADNFSSFPGTGNFWYDLSQSNYDFTINSDAFRTVNDIKHMDFEGSYGAAQYIVNGSRLNVPSYSNATMQVFTSIKNTTSDHRTLVRGSANDHPVIIEIGNNNLGMHDNDNGGFIDTGFDITSLPNPYTQFNFLDFKLAQSSPYMKFRYNTDTNVYQITDPNANYHRGFHAIGKWFQNQNNVNTGSQWWGKIGVFLYYDRELTESETTQNFNAFASRFGLESEADNTAPEIFSSKLKVDNSVVSITFTEAVYNSSNGSGNLEASDFNLTISGGNATLSSSNPSSILIDGSTISLGIPLNGIPDGDEILTISPANNAIFDAAGNPASTSQTSNTIQLISDIVTSGLMIYLDASNENSYSGSGSIWYDLTSNGNDGVISGTTFSNDGGGSFEFGSSSDYVEIGDDPSLDMDNNQMTISYLIEIDRTGTNWSPAIEKGSGLNNCGTGNLNYYTWYGNNDLQIDFVGNTNLRGQLYYATADDFYTGQFRLITITIDQSNFVKTYIDGEIKHTLNHNGQVLGPVTDGPLVIGKCPDPDGKIRSLMIYNRALSSDEVYQNYNSLSKAPKIISTSISADNSTVSVTFDQLVYNSNSGSGNLETTDFSLSISGGTSTLSSSTPSSISISGDTIELGVPLAGSYNGNEQLTVNLTSYSVFNSIGYNASSQQISNTVSLNNLAPTDIGFQSSNIPTDGLVLHLDAQNSNSNTGSDDRWSDLSSSGNDILFSNPKPLFTQDSNGVKILRTTNATGSLRNMVSAPTNPNVVIGNNAYTAISFFKPNSTDSRRMLLSYGPPDNSCNGAQLHPLAINNKGKFGGGSCGGRNTWETNSGVTPSTSQYVFQATSWDGSTERVYINGTLDKSSSSHTNNVTDSNNNKFSIGWVRDDGASYTMDADIGVILFYNRKLTDSEINDIYQNYNDRFTNGQIPSSSNGSVQEGSSVGTLVTNLVATDPDSTEFTFSLVSGDGSNDIHNSYFTVSGTQLLVNNGDIDFETTPILNINLQVSDGLNTVAKAFTVSVTNINEAPTEILFETTGVNLEYLVVGGGGGGGGGDVGAGGGAGGFRTNKTGSQSGGGCAAEAPMAITAGTYTVVVGAGGNGGSDSYGWASDGGDSSFNGIISKGGGGAPGWRASDGRAGGSGSGSTGQGGNNPGSGESCQGHDGGTGLGGGNYPQGGGGGAGGLGENAPSQDQAGAGGPGLPNPFEDSNIGELSGGQRYLAGGGGGGAESNATVGNGGVGGGGIGGRQTPNLDPGNGLPNTGGGGGGEDNQTGGSGGSGVVILRYLGNPIATGGTVTQSGGYTMHTFTQVGNSYLTVSSGGTSTSTASFDEGSAVGTMVAKLTATDPDSTDFTFSLISGDGSNDIHNSYFTVSGTQLLVNNADIDFETTPSLNIYVQASDGVNIFAKALTVSVTNINESPTDIGLSSNTISESVSASSTIATLSAVDSDTSDTHIFTLIDGDGSNDADNSSFTISGTSLIINSTADYETKSSYSIYINVNDGLNDFAKTFTMSVTNIDEVPVDIELESNQNVIQNNLILHLDAENSQSYPGTGDIWYDLTSNSNDFNLNGATYDENGFINFDGENDWARTISTLDLSAYDHVTIQINALIENNSEVEITFEHSENWNTNDGGFGLANHCGGSTYINNLHHTNHMGFPRNYEADLVNEFQLQTNIFSTISDPTGRLTYIDENLINFSNQPTGTYPNGTSTSNDLNFGNYHFYIGSRGGTNHYLNGKVKSLLIYGSKFSADDVKMNFEALNTNENISVKEISSVGSLVANLVATDPDSSNFTFSLVQGDGSNDVHNSYFTVSGTQLLVNNPNIDFESTPSLNINLQVSDGANTFAKAFTVSVTNINEAPIDLGFTTSSLLENGLVLYLDSRNPNSYSGSGNTWSDLSGNSNDFIMVGNFSHSASNGFDFETGQSTKYFKDDSFAHPTTTFTDEFLIKTSRNTNSAWKSYNVSGNDNQSLMMQFSNEDNLYLGLPGGDFYSNVSGISDGAWHHLVRTSNRTSGAEKIYLDGQLVYNQTVQAGSLITTNGHYYIGQEQDSPGGGLDASQAFDGFLPIVRLYNRVLTAEEVSSNFSAMISNGNPTPVNSSGSSSSTASFDEGSAVGTV